MRAANGKHTILNNYRSLHHTKCLRVAAHLLLSQYKLNKCKSLLNSFTVYAIGTIYLCFRLPTKCRLLSKASSTRMPNRCRALWAIPFLTQQTLANSQPHQTLQPKTRNHCTTPCHHQSRRNYQVHCKSGLQHTS